MNIDEIRASCTGRWAGILASLGADVGDGKHKPCPLCHAEKDWFRFDDKEGAGTWICNQCGAGDGFHFVEKLLGVDFMGAVKAITPLIDSAPVAAVVEQDDAVSREYFRNLFKYSVPATESNLVGRYLISRGLSTVPPCLRLHKNMKEPNSGNLYPTMLALVTMPDGQNATMHRVFLSEPGVKAPVAKPKKTLPVLPQHRGLRGAAIRLFEVGESQVLGVAEGIETAIACHEMYSIPVWSVRSADGMEKFEVPPTLNIKSVVVFADNDKTYTGQHAAYHLANRLVVQRGLACDVEVPPDKGDDFMDVLVKHLKVVA